MRLSKSADDKIVISLGGSVLFNENGKIELKKVQKYGKVIDDLSRDYKIFVVVGGGRVARDFINIARNLGADETTCDKIGISVTRINAQLLALSIRSAAKIVPRTFDEAYELSSNFRTVVMGGTFPGHTTDATAALLAEFVGAKLLLNATSVDGIYTKDPVKYADAKKVERISPSELLNIILREKAVAGSKVVLDSLSVKIIERSKIKTVVFLGTPENIKKVVKGERIGTLIET